jgi:hypothetical protein
MPITVAARFKERTVFARSNDGNVGSNPTQGIDVYVRFHSVFLLPCVQVATLRRADHLSKESCRMCKKKIKKLKKRPGPNKGL